MKQFIKIITLCLIMLSSSSCVYYNTFYLARKAFNDAESKRKSLGRAGARVGTSQYKKAINKAEKIIEKYPNSKWYDDALYVSGVSHFWTEDFSKADRRFRELIANFPESEYFKESSLYLAKSKLKMSEIDDAMELFENLFTESKEKWIKAEAAMALSEYYIEETQFKQAEPYLHSLIDSLGNNEEKIIAKFYMADGLFSRFSFRQALETYRELLDEDLTKENKYRALYSSGECHYFLNDIGDGIEIFNGLAENDLYFDSIPSIKLMIARGLEWDGDLLLAEEVYEQVAIESPLKPQGAYSNYMLGLIYQYEYEDYKKAKEYYDAAKSAGAQSGIYEDVLLRSSNIGKLEEYINRDYNLDSTSTQEEVDQAAETQYLLAELYLMQLGKPDSAMQEFAFIINNFSDSYLAPKTHIAIALMNRDYYNDTLAFDSILRNVIKEYSRSDFVPEVIDLLGLAGTAADTGYAAYYYRKAEHFIFDDKNIDSAQFYVSIVADSFPYSKLNEQAKFTRLWLIEEFESPGDSSLYFAYAYYADSFPSTKFGKAANKKLVVKPRIERETDELASDEEDESETGDELAGVDGDIAEGSSGVIKTLEELCHIDLDGKTIFTAQTVPTRYDKEFRFPPAALAEEFPDVIEFCVQIRIDPFGEVGEAVLINPSISDELNDEIIETILTAHFDTYWILPEFVDSWWAFTYRVEIPSHLR